MQAGQPFLRHMLQRRLLEGLLPAPAVGAPFDEGVGGEFGVALPLQAEAAEVMEKIACLCMRHRHAEMQAQFFQDAVLGGAVLLLRRLLLLHVEREMGQRFRRFQVQEGPRMDLGRQGHPHRMVQLGEIGVRAVDGWHGFPR